MIVFITGSAIFLMKFSEVNKKDNQERYELISNILADNISHLFWEQYNDLKSISENLNLSVLSPQELQNKLNKEASRHNNWDLLLIVDPLGNYLSSNTFDSNSTSIDLEALKSTHYNTENWFQSVMNNNFSETQKLKGVYVTDFNEDNLIKIAFKDKRASSSFSAPIKNLSGQIIAIITARVNSGWFENIFQNYYQKNRDSIPFPEFHVLNGDNLIILEYTPTAQNSSSQMTHDFNNTLLRKKLDKINNISTPWNQLTKSSSGIFKNITSDLSQIFGFTPINHDRFLNSLHWKILIRGNATDTLKVSQNLQWVAFLFFSIIAFLSLLGAWYWSNKIHNNINNISRTLTEAGEQIISVSHELNQSTNQMVHVSQNKNHSLENTSAALEEISGMIKTNVREVENVNVKAKEVNTLTLDTQKWMLELTRAMQAIQESNARISELVKIIEEIGEKTEIIDDIVFKTQLLSFNASVEAERAGEHGRGFSVVAQEVGNLAQLSGKAATEISTIVKKSIREADTVSKENKERVEKGEQLTQETYDKLTSVINKVDEIFKSTNQIALASKDQNEGIYQITTNLSTMNLESEEKKEATENYSKNLKEFQGKSESLLKFIKKMNPSSGKRAA